MKADKFFTTESVCYDFPLHVYSCPSWLRDLQSLKFVSAEAPKPHARARALPGRKGRCSCSSMLAFLRLIGRWSLA